MERVISVTVEPLEEGGYLVTSNDLPDLLAQGRTVAEALEIAQDVAQKLVESHVDHGDPLPLALAQSVDAAVTLHLNIAIAVST